MISLELFEISLVFEKSRPQTTKNLTVRLKNGLKAQKLLVPGIALIVNMEWQTSPDNIHLR